MTLTTLEAKLIYRSHYNYTKLNFPYSSYKLSLIQTHPTLRPANDGKEKKNKNKSEPKWRSAKKQVADPWVFNSKSRQNLRFAAENVKRSGKFHGWLVVGIGNGKGRGGRRVARTQQENAGRAFCETHMGSWPEDESGRCARCGGAWGLLHAACRSRGPPPWPGLPRSG